MSAIKASKELVKQAQYITGLAKTRTGQHQTLCEIESSEGDYYTVHYDLDSDTYDISKAPASYFAGDGDIESVCEKVGKNKVNFMLVTILQNAKKIAF